MNPDPHTIGHVAAGIVIAVSAAVHAWHAGIRRARGGGSVINIPTVWQPTKLSVPAPKPGHNDDGNEHLPIEDVLDEMKERGKRPWLDDLEDIGKRLTEVEKKAGAGAIGGERIDAVEKRLNLLIGDVKDSLAKRDERIEALEKAGAGAISDTHLGKRITALDVRIGEVGRRVSEVDGRAQLHAVGVTRRDGRIAELEKKVAAGAIGGERIDMLRKELHARLDAVEKKVAAVGEKRLWFLHEGIKLVNKRAESALDRLDALKDASGLREWQREEREIKWTTHEAIAKADTDAESGGAA